jgi:DNA invertase Pin-like site-specific DNA recombinase
VIGKHFDRLSGGEKDRPGLAAAVADVVKGRAEILMVDALDRLGRNVRHILETVDALEEAGGNLFVVDLGIDTNTPAGRMALTSLATLAEYQRRENVRKVLAGIAYARKKGIRLGRPPALSAPVLARAVALRRSRPRPSWREIVRQLRTEKLGKYPKGTVAGAVTRTLQALRGKGKIGRTVKAFEGWRRRITSTRSSPARKRGGRKSPPKTVIKNPRKIRASRRRPRRSRIT